MVINSEGAIHITLPEKPPIIPKNNLTKHLESNKIQPRNYFAGNILMHPGYSHLDYYKNYPNACKVLDLVFFLGCSPTITKPMIDYIGTITDKFIK